MDGPDCEHGGVPAHRLDDATLLRYLTRLHRTRLCALRHASYRALVTHIARTGELETEYLRRHPSREVTSGSGAR